MGLKRGRKQGRRGGYGGWRPLVRGTFQLVIKTCRAATSNPPISTLHSGWLPLLHCRRHRVATAAIL